MDVTGALFVGFLTFFLAWYTQYHWKRRRLYKLASAFPGPLALPIIGSAWYLIGKSASIHTKVVKLVKQYPDISRIWIGSTLVVAITHPEYIGIVLNNPKALNKHISFKHSRQIAGNGLFSAPASIWKKHRKMLNPTFHQHILQDFVEIVADNSEIIVNKLKKYAGKGEFDLPEVMFDFSLSTLYETSLGMRGQPKLWGDDFASWLDKFMELFFVRMSSIVYRLDIIYKFSKDAELVKTLISNLRGVTSQIVKNKKRLYEQALKDESNKENLESEGESVKKRKEIFAETLLRSNRESQLTEEECVDHVTTLIIAGTDTTTAVLSFTCLCLGMCQDIQSKVFEEVMEIVGPDRKVTADDLTKMKFLERVLKESLRLFPVAPFILRNLEGDIKVDTYTIPEGSSVFVPIVYIHRNPEFWPDPLKFDPDRFLLEEVQKRRPYTYMPFAAGPRDCIGKRYAMMSMKVLLAHMVRKYKFFTNYKSFDEIKLHSRVITQPLDGYKVYLESRQ